MPEAFDLGSSMEETYAEIQQSGGGDDSPDGLSPPDQGGGLPSSSTPPASSAAPTSTPTPQANPWDVMPKSWKKDYEPKWGTIDPEVRRNIYEREQQALNGIMQYKSAADKWQSTMDPFKQWFDHYKIDPHDAFKRLATSHIVLKYGKPEDRARYAQQLIQDYGLAEVLGLQPQQGQPAGGLAHQSNEQVFQLEQRLNALQEEAYQRSLKENMATVEKFFSDPANEYAADLQDDILRIFEKGAASTLQEAYEMAMWNNPAVRAKIMQREVDKATKPQVKGPPNVKSSSVAPAPTEGDVEESLEDTMKATLHRINSR